jgi:hypothetical protein
MAVGVDHVDIELNQGVECASIDHTVSLNAVNVGTLMPGVSCSCTAPLVVRNLPDLDATSYVKAGLNMLTVSTTSCAGLNNDSGTFAVVTVTYENPPAQAAVA